MIDIALTYGLIIIIFVFAGIYGLLRNAKAFQLFGFGTAIIEILFLSFTLYLNELGESFTSLMLINFYGLLFVFTFISLAWIFNFVSKMMNPSEDLEEDDKKWRKR